MSDLISELGFYAEKQRWPNGLEGMPDLLKRAQAALSTDAEPVSRRNDEAGYVEFINEDRPYIVRDIHAPVAILTDLETRNVIGYRVYDPNSAFAPQQPAPSVAVNAEDFARQLWGYFKGDSTGGTTAMQWFDNNKSLGGPAHLIELCLRALSKSIDDGSCIKCGFVPINKAGLCATCVDEAALSTDAKPVAWRWKYKDSEDWVDVSLEEPNENQRKLLVVEPVYAAPPAPSVAVRALRDIMEFANEATFLDEGTTESDLRGYSRGVHFTAKEFARRISSALSAQVQDVAEPKPTWQGWDKNNPQEHQDKVCHALFGSEWWENDEKTLVAFIDRTFSAAPAAQHGEPT